MTEETPAAADLVKFVGSLPGVDDCAAALSQEQWVVAIRSNGAVGAVEYRNLIWEHLGTDGTAPAIVLTDPSSVGELTAAVVEQAAPEQRSLYVAARDEVEEFVCGIVAAATETSAVGADDDLFDLGADSLVLIEVTTAIFERYEVRLEMQEVFEAGSPAKISDLVKARTPR
ncbi:acyl carrier protein [Streptomyces glaucescens]|jgi:acyl carrier protein